MKIKSPTAFALAVMLAVGVGSCSAYNNGINGLSLGTGLIVFVTFYGVFGLIIPYYVGLDD